MKKLLFIIIFVLTFTSCGAADTAPQAPAEPQAAVSLAGITAENYPRVDGSTANMPLMAALYSKICGVPAEEAETLVQTSGGTGAAWRTLLWGEPDLLLIYEAPESVREELEAEGVWQELEITPVGRDGLVFLVNAQNPVNGLTQAQLVDIYSGKTTDWSGVGGASGPITAFQRNEESGSQTLFQKLLMKDKTPMDAPSELMPMAMAGLMDVLSEYDGSGGAIGYSVFYYANLMYEKPNLKLLEVDGTAPTAESIGKGGYPLTNEFYAVINKSAPQDSPERLIRDWLVTEEGRGFMRENNYVPIG
jgi:phosphate transport system substrate-binding protein